jgi:two-component system, OmpR family, response regulator
MTRILIVEDDASLAESLAALIRKAGFSVDVSRNGADAMHLTVTENYAAVVLDLGLPVFDGIIVLNAIREAKRTAPVLVLTARDRLADKAKAFKAGADDYLTKPFEPEELLLRLRALLRRSTGVTQIVVEVGHLSLDTATGAIACSGKQLSLTHLETQVLTHFIHHADAVVSRTQISEAVYELERDVNFNTLEVIVSRLRKKIGHDSIETVRGGGYRLRGQKISNALD